MKLGLCVIMPSFLQSAASFSINELPSAMLSSTSESEGSALRSRLLYLCFVMARRSRYNSEGMEIYLPFISKPVRYDRRMSSPLMISRGGSGGFDCLFQRKCMPTPWEGRRNIYATASTRWLLSFWPHSDHSVYSQIFSYAAVSLPFGFCLRCFRHRRLHQAQIPQRTGSLAVQTTDRSRRPGRDCHRESRSDGKLCVRCKMESNSCRNTGLT